MRLPALAPGAEHFDAYEQFTLRRPTPDQWEIAFKNGQSQHFERAREDLFALPLAAIGDRNGNRIAFDYPELPDDPFEPWRPHAITDSAGRRLLLEWDRRGLLTSVALRVAPVAPLHNLASYVYSADGDLVAHTDANGARRGYEWRNHVLVAYTKADGARYCADYDEYSPFGRVLRSYAAADGRGLRFEYDERARTTRTTDALGRTTRYEYDERKDIVATTGADGVRVEMPFDANGNPRGISDPLGRQTLYRFDGRGNLAELVDPAGARTAIEYNAMDLPVKLTDAMNHAWLREYDELGNLTVVVDPLGQATSYKNNSHGQPVTITDARGGIKQLKWDRAGNLIGYTDCSGQSTRFVYDGLGRLLTRTDALGQARIYHWDAAGRLLDMTEPDGALHRYQWSSEGRLSAYINPLGAITSYRYNSHGEPVERYDANGHTLGYAYDANGRLTRLTNENGDVTIFDYDLADQLTDEIGFDGRHQRYCYNKAGELTHLVEAGGSDFGPGKVTRFDRDALGRLVAKLAEDDSSCQTQYTYDALGRMTAADNPAAKLAFAYDPVGQLLSETQTLAGSQPRVLRHHFDVLGNRIQTTLPDTRSLHWLFYGSGHLHQINLEKDGKHSIIADIERDVLHREVSRSQGALHSRYDYDPMGRLTHHRTSPASGYSSIKSGQEATVGIDRSYRYDASGKLMAQFDALRGKQTFRYDPTGRILAAIGRMDEYFAFDPAGNLQPSQPDQVPGKVKGNRLTVYQDLRYSYDIYGNVKTRHKGTHEQTNYAWNANHQLQHAMVSRNGVTQTTSYEYDALGRRTRKNDAFGSTDYLWDGDLMIESRRGKKESLFVFELHSFVPLATIQNDNTYWYQCDQIGLPQDLTDVEGNIVWATEFKVWGEATLRKTGTDRWATSWQSADTSSPAIEQPFRFQGQQFDEETGLHYNRFRYYDPAIGRFISEDPIGILGGMNVFSYVPNTNSWSDPLGLKSTAKLRKSMKESGKPCPRGYAAHHLIAEQF